MFKKRSFFKKILVNNLSLIIIIFPIIALLFYGGFVSLFLVTKQHNYAKQEIKNFENNIINEQKKLLKDKVKNIKSFIQFSEKKSYDRVKKEIKTVVTMAYDVMENIYKKNRYSETPEEIAHTIKLSLEKIRFNQNRGYLFINNIDGTVIMHPFNANLEGQNLIDMQDEDGKYFIKEFKNIIEKQSEGYYEYKWFKPEFGLYRQYKKISYIKAFEPYNWYVGAGEYFYDIKEDIKEDIFTFLESIKLYESGFIFIFDENGKLIKHPCAEEFLNVNDEEVKNHSTEILSKFKRAAREQKFLYYEGKDCISNRFLKKMAFVYYVEEYKWYIVISKNMKDINSLIEKQKSSLIKRIASESKLNIILLFSFSIISFIISIMLSNIINQTLNKYKEELSNNQKTMLYQSRLAQAGELLSMIAHQWRQPLSKIAAVVSSLRFDIMIGKKDIDEFDERLEKIEEYTEHLSETIDDFKSFYKPSKEKKRSKIAPLIERAIEFLENSLKKKDIKIIKDYSNDEEFLLHPNELIQVFINLIQNAIDVLDKKGIIKIYFRIEEDIFIINIEDNGGGIDEKYIDKIFESHFSTKESSSNLGLGLYMSKIIVEKHLNSKLEVKNSPNGAIFMIKIKR